jgi:glutamyl-Q tRNA(Asp) synthetase
MTEHNYRGRFAPSPTGPLHFGSLVAAVGSYLDARSRQGEWLLRMEDIDPPREVAGAADRILFTLEDFGLHWDGPVLYQSTRSEAYHAALEQLERAGHLFGCACTRREIADSGGMDSAAVYPGTCRNGLPPGRPARATRVRVGDHTVTFEDALQGTVSQALGSMVGDFVVRRADGLFAYQLAVVVDDAAQGITHVVRGADLLDSTPRQVFLQQLLGHPAPAYLHLPVAVNAAHEKLSKQTFARDICEVDRVLAVRAALDFLNQPLPRETGLPLAELWQWAIAHWDRGALPAQRNLPAPAALQNGSPAPL